MIHAGGGGMKCSRSAILNKRIKNFNRRTHKEVPHTRLIPGVPGLCRVLVVRDVGEGGGWDREPLSFV